MAISLASRKITVDLNVCKKKSALIQDSKGY